MIGRVQPVADEPSQDRKVKPGEAVPRADAPPRYMEPKAPSKDRAPAQPALQPTLGAAPAERSRPRLPGLGKVPSDPKILLIALLVVMLLAAIWWFVW